MSIKKTLQLIRNNQTFLISAHVNPDPDALCSELALALYLKSIGKTVIVLNEEPVPDRFMFFPGIHLVKSLSKMKSIKYDVAIIVDCGELKRIGKVQEVLSDDAKIINIDHHVTNDLFGDVNFVNVKASSTCEMLYELLKKGKCLFTESIALNLYSGIMTDTGSFRYENTSSKTLVIASELRKFKFSASDLYTKLYEQLPLSDLKLFMKVASDFDSLHKGKVVVVELKKAQVAKFSETFDLRDTIFKFLRTIQSVEVIVIITEFKKDRTRVNLRSSGKVDVAKLASRFDGGGHKKASGCMIYKDFKNARKAVLSEIKKVI